MAGSACHFEPVGFSRKAVKIPFLLPEEKKFVTNVEGTLKDRPRSEIRWIVDDENEVVGMVAFGPDTDERGEDCWWIHRLMVRPDARRRGFASVAISIIIEQASIGTEILTSIVPGNRAAQRLFRSMNFKRTNRKWNTETIWRFRKRRYFK